MHTIKRSTRRLLIRNFRNRKDGLIWFISFIEDRNWGHWSAAFVFGGRAVHNVSGRLKTIILDAQRAHRGTKRRELRGFLCLWGVYAWLLCSSTSLTKVRMVPGGLSIFLYFLAASFFPPPWLLLDLFLILLCSSSIEAYPGTSSILNAAKFLHLLHFKRFLFDSWETSSKEAI